MISVRRCTYRIAVIITVTVITSYLLRILPYYRSNVPNSKTANQAVDVSRYNIYYGTSTEREEVMPSIYKTGITMAEILEKLNRRMRVSVEKNKNCQEVHNNSTAFWRSTTEGMKTHEQDLIRMNLAAACGAFNHSELMSYNPRDPPFPWELDYFSQPPLRNISETVNASTSSIELLNSTTANFRAGETVMFKIVLRKKNGERREQGGDSVRLWLVSPALGASTAADVIDNKDGSFLAISLLPWSGEVKVRATIAHSRELFRAALFIQRIFKSSHGFTGTFASSEASESTPCSPFPAIPAFPAHEVCNLTDKNGGYPWYCGRPVKRDVLNCSHWVSVRKLNLPSNIPLTEAEEKVVLQTETLRPMLIPNNITLTVLPDLAEQSVLATPGKMCNQRPLSQTFDDTNQSGFFFTNTWRPFDCQLPRVDKHFLLDCLKNTQVILIGDSNTRLQFDILKKIMECSNKILRTRAVWHAPLQCDNDSLGLSVKYYPPKHPFYGSMNEDMQHHDLFSAVNILDNIPSTGNYLVHLHDFLHVIPSHLAMAEHRLHLLRAAIARLVLRNPKVYVIYQSVHSAYDRKPLNKHKLNVFLLELQRNILKGLGDRVMFSLSWPMTIAAENNDGHPEISNHFVALYMGYVCGRW